MEQGEENQLTGTFRPTAENTELLDELFDRLVPKVTAVELQLIERALRRAQVHPPEDPVAFVQKMNRLFDVCCLRIRTEDGALGRLRCLVQDTGRSYIQISGRGRAAFLNARLCIAKVPADYERRKHHNISSREDHCGVD